MTITLCRQIDCVEREIESIRKRVGWTQHYVEKIRAQQDMETLQAVLQTLRDVERGQAGENK